MLLGESDYFVSGTGEGRTDSHLEIKFCDANEKKGIYEIAPFFIFCVDSKDDRTL